MPETRREILERHAQAAEAQVEVSERLLECLQRPEKDRKRHELQLAYARPPSRFLHGEKGLRAMARIPGFAALFLEKPVPESHLLRAEGRDGGSYTILRCPCGAHTVLGRPPIDECTNSCGRFFLVGRDDVWVHRFARPDSDEPPS